LKQEDHMAESTLHQVQRLAPVTPPETAEAWEEFFRLGDAIAASDTPVAGTLTAAVLVMRR
jgi:hypothetical protein